MKSVLSLVLGLGAPLAPLASSAPETTAEAPRQEPDEDSLGDLKSVIDHSIRWLRSVQDLESGRYGTGVEATAQVLTTLATSPRHYVLHDGPFVQRAVDYLLAHAGADGAIHDPAAGEQDKRRQTAAAARALRAYDDERTALAAERAEAWLERVGAPPAEAPERPERDAARSRATELLAKRDAEGFWEGGPDEDRALATARALEELGRIHEVLQPPAEPPREARALPEAKPVDAATLESALLRGARYLVSQALEPGRFGAGGRADLGITAMVVGALQSVAEPRPEDVQRAIDQGLEWIASQQREDGSIHDGKLQNYQTCVAILALSRAEDDAYRENVLAARDWLIGLQSDEGEGYDPSHPYYGGVGYGGDERPDLSNLQMALEALAASGLESDHVVYRRALRFLERCQNRSESNDVELVGEGARIESGDDGGAAYAPGDSPAGFVELEDGRKAPRSYGSMSYALLKGYVFAGVPADDPRMVALMDWLEGHWTLDVNPGFEASEDPGAAYQGLFYYFYTLARALDVAGIDRMVDGQGASHDWRAELAGRLIAMQRPNDGSWVNENAARWWEGNPVLATSYALLALERCRARG